MTWKSQAVSHSFDGRDDILISWDVKYILEDEKREKVKMKKIYNEKRKKEDRITGFRESTCVSIYTYTYVCVYSLIII